MNLHHLGEQIDIHGGGNDLIFPHHENEIAQTETFTSKLFARYWVHNGMLQFGGEKMSKSVGNLVTIEEYLSHHSADSLRLMILNSAYRSPLTFTDEVIGQSEKAIERLQSGLRPAPKGVPGAAGKPLSEAALQALGAQTAATKAGYLEAMDDDFNTAGALGHLFDLVRAINQARADGADNPSLEPAQGLLRELTGVFGLQLTASAQTADGNANPFIDLLVELRSDLRRQKLWALSDRIRNRLTELGVVIEDNKDGTAWRWG
jgi:cysteinyl-tRNA synthetase